jgi:hypothetical protein
MREGWTVGACLKKGHGDSINACEKAAAGRGSTPLKQKRLPHGTPSVPVRPPAPKWRRRSGTETPPRAHRRRGWALLQAAKWSAARARQRRPLRAGQPVRIGAAGGRSEPHHGHTLTHTGDQPACPPPLPSRNTTHHHPPPPPPCNTATLHHRHRRNPPPPQPLPTNPSPPQNIHHHVTAASTTQTHRHPTTPQEQWRSREPHLLSTSRSTARWRK